MQYLHPRTQIPVDGVLLSTGAQLEVTDVYASTNGEWEVCPCPGLILQSRCKTVWVRPFRASSLTPEALSLLGYLIHWKFYLAPGSWGGWAMIPAPHWKGDRRMDWRVDASCAEALISAGLVLPTGQDSEIYTPTEVGQQIFRSSNA